MAPFASLDAGHVESENGIYAPLGVLIANFLSAAGGNRGGLRRSAERLGAFGWRIVATSRRTGRVGRVIDILIRPGVGGGITKLRKSVYSAIRHFFGRWRSAASLGVLGNPIS